MAIVAAKKQRDPDSPIQNLRTKKHGVVKVVGKFWIVGPGVGKIIIPTPEGGYRYARGGPIRNKNDLMELPEPDREKALFWWDNKDNWRETAPRKIGFQIGTGYPIFEDDSTFVEREEDLLTNWPGDSPIFWAAHAALIKRREAQVEQLEPRPVLEVVQGGGVSAPEAPTAQPEKPEAVKPPPLHAGKGKKLTKTQLADRRAKLAATKAAKEAKAAAAAIE